MLRFVSASVLAFVVGTAACALAQVPAPATSPAAAPTVLGAPAAIESPAAAAAVLIPAGAPAKISLTEQLASNVAHAGDKFQFRSLEDVTVDGWIVISKGSLGEGEVLSAESAGGNGHPGKMKLQFNWIYGPDNLKIKLSDVPSSNDGDAAKGAASTATIASYVLLGPLGLFAHNFVHGHDVVVKPDQKIQVFVSQAVHVTPTSKVTAADGFAH
jgi:hypothetical protein